MYNAIVTTLLIFVFLSVGIKVNAQNVSAYTFAQTAGTYTAITGPTTAIAAATDDAVATLTIPFSFTFAGTSYTSCLVNTNGYVVFGAAGLTNIYTPISSITGSGVISAFGRDLNSGVTYSTTGTTPNRKFIIQFIGYRYGNSLLDNLNFQVQLNETTNAINVVYGTATTTSTTADNTIQIGLRGAAITDYNNRSLAAAANWNTAVAGVANTAYVRFRNTAFPTSGLTWTWTPPVIVAAPLCAATPTSPTNGLTGVATSPTLTWAAVTNATSYDIYLGTAASPPFVINTASTTYSPAALAANTLYYWKIIPKNAIGAAIGCSTWSFTTTTPGCTNTSSYGTVTAPTNNTITTISTLQYQSEYSTINSAIAWSTYQSTYSIAGTYITVHQGTYNGPIIAFGFSPLNWTPTASGTYFVHYNTNSSCGTASISGTSTIQCTTCAGCVTPGTPTSLSGTATGSSTATISWAAGSPAGSATITYYYNVYTSTGTYVTGSSSASSPVSITGLACGTLYYFTVYSSTSCNSTSSLTATSSNFTSGACPPPPANDLVCNATAITCGQTLSGTTI